MSIELYLNAEDKLSALTELKSMIAKELYISCINCGIDPDTFDHMQYLSSIEENPSINSGLPRVGLHDLSKKLQMVEAKIASI